MYRLQQDVYDRLIGRVVKAQAVPLLGKVARAALRLRGTDIPASTIVGADGLVLRHSAPGVVLHPRTRVGKNVTIFQHVTVGRADIWQPYAPDMAVIIEDEAILCAGAVVVARHELTIGEGSVVGANAVLTESTGPWEVWAGAPARLVGKRPH